MSFTGRNADTSLYVRADGQHTAPSGGSGGAPTNAEYVVKTASGSLSAERVLTDGTSITADWSVSNQVTLVLADNGVTYAKIQDASAGNVVLARAAGTSGDYGEVALGASQLLGRGSTGNIAAITLGSGLSMSGTTLSSSGSGLTYSQVFSIAIIQ